MSTPLPSPFLFPKLEMMFSPSHGITGPSQQRLASPRDFLFRHSDLSTILYQRAIIFHGCVSRQVGVKVYVRRSGWCRSLSFISLALPRCATSLFRCAFQTSDTGFRETRSRQRKTCSPFAPPGSLRPTLRPTPPSSLVRPSISVSTLEKWKKGGRREENGATNGFA